MRKIILLLTNIDSMSKLVVYPDEVFKEISLPDKITLRYAISNKGRFISFSNSMDEGKVLNCSMTDGYRIFRYKIKVNRRVKNKHIFLYKLVAEYFIPKTSEDQVHILHLDRVRDNDDVCNLKWATREERLQHNRTSPFVIEAKKKLWEHNIKSDGAKLTVTKVILIKKILARPNQKTRLKIIAKQFGVSEMQIRRIKSGENWSSVTI